MFFCRSSNVFGYGVLPHTPLGILSNIILIKSEKFCIPKHIWPQEFWIRDCGPVVKVFSGRYERQDVGDRSEFAHLGFSLG